MLVKIEASKSKYPLARDVMQGQKAKTPQGWNSLYDDSVKFTLGASLEALIRFQAAIRAMQTFGPRISNFEATHR